MRHPVTAAPIPERVRTLAAVAAPTHVSVMRLRRAHGHRPGRRGRHG